MVDVAGAAAGPGRAVLADEERQDAAVAGVEEQVGQFGGVEVRLFEHQRHSEQVAVEGDAASTIAFYRDLLGMPLVLEQPNLDAPELTHLFFEIGRASCRERV